MGRGLMRASVRVALASALLIFGVVQGSAFAETKGDDPKSSDSAIRAKVARINASRITQEQREAAAARLKLMQSVVGLTAQGSLRAAASITPTQGGQPDYFGATANWAYSPLIRKFVDGLPGLGAAKANNLGQYLTVAKPDTITYPGSDYYEIELRQYTEKMHSDLPPTTLRGYVQVNNGTNGSGVNNLVPDPIHYLGPTIVARKDRPVRIKFTNKLPINEAGDLFIPVDTSVMGAGEGPTPGKMYSQNRGTLHLHGGITPWISDGTPHQWITPAGEVTEYPKGVSVKNVPDMPDPGDGSQTFFYSNQQSARLLFYHDHSYGITRLNVYAGEAAAYLISDPTEDKLVADGTIPAEQIPLVIQDKTFVDSSTVLTTDPTWNWGTGPMDPITGYRQAKTGDLWLPHVYIPAQNPALIDGINPTGRWHYGPWFWPPIPDSALQFPPIPNPYYDPVNAPWEPPLMPATPNPSMGMEAFHDTPVVNGTPYPTLDVQPKPYRLRILNASNDRFWNLQMYTADPAVVTSDGRRNTEVKMVPAAPTAGYPALWPTDGREGGVPDPATAGPAWIQIGTEGGFLPAPAVIPQQPVTWNANQSMFNFGNVQDHSLLLGAAERADVIVDFSQYAGKTIILYNDSPAPFPALDPRMDYYTGDLDNTGEGGTLSTLPGFGPNTRTIMQIKVAAAPVAPAFDLAKLNAAFASTPTQDGVFKSSQNPIIVPDARYNSAYGTSTLPADPYVRIFNNEKTFRALDGRTVTIPLQPKAIQDETSEVWDYVYGRMSGKLGLEMPRTNATNANFVLYSFFDPATENLDAVLTPLSPIGADGTQLWKITHNGVDTHPIHWHLFDVQLINRVGWDGFIRTPDDNELGWKDTIRISPLEDTIVAVRPIVPKLPFGIPNSWRPLDPTQPIDGTMGFSNINPLTGQLLPTAVKNAVVNFGWEYVWHCHILSHEEMDMMRPIAVTVETTLPLAPVLAAAGLPGTPVDLTWIDPTPANDPATWGNPRNEIGFRVERATVDVFGVESAYVPLGNVLANVTTFQDATTAAGTAYRYRVFAFNASGETASNAVTVAPPGFFTSYTISPFAGPNGAIAPSTPQTVPRGLDSPLFTFAPALHYHVSDVQVDGVSVGTPADYTFTNVQNDHAIWAFFALDQFAITSSAGANGSISPLGSTLVDYGGSQAYAITPATGYHVADVLVDGGSVGAVTAYTFTNVTATHTIAATFAPNTYTITPTAGANGTITPGTPQGVVMGGSATFSIVPNAGYRVLDVLVDGGSVGAVSTYTFTNVTAPHTISATFAAKIPTSVTINSSTFSTRVGRAFVLTGALRPAQPQGTVVVVEVLRPGSSRWSYSSARGVDAASNWWYRYTPIVRGTYRFRANFAGNAVYAPSVSRTISVLIW